jgi:pyruvate dehydrogenase E2 component (dihydrolipoamide acetyltransferase)
MASKVIMPKLGLTMTEGTLSRWLKKEGDAVKAGEPLFAVETDKLTNEIEAKADGMLRKIVVKEGATAPCLATVAIIGAVDEDIDGML